MIAWLPFLGWQFFYGKNLLNFEKWSNMQRDFASVKEIYRQI